MRGIARAASAFALAEMAAGLTIGQFIARDRAEAAIFLAYCPWLLLVMAVACAGWPWRRRAAAALAAILLASGGEALLVAMLGGERVAVDAARAVVANVVLAALLDGAIGAARRVEPRFGRLLGALLGIGLLAVPGPLMLFGRIALAPDPAPPGGPRPAVTLLTGLPVLWDEAGGIAALRPNAAMRRLGSEFTLRPIDVASPSALARAPLLLAAQPRELSADEIEAVDRWVRMGGRALLLADPDLRWPGALPPGDPRRPPRWATLAPLLAGWGITIARTDERIATIDVASPGGLRRIVADAPGRLRADGGCRPIARAPDPWRAIDCRIGRGRAIMLADADMLDDRLWVGMGEGGDGRLRRGGDNALLIAGWLDELAVIRRDRRADSVSWRLSPVTPWVWMGALAPAPMIGLFGVSDIGRRLARKDIVPHMVIHRNKAGRVAEMRARRRQAPDQ